MFEKLIKFYIKLVQWKTPRQIIVFESDDWGSVRMTNIESFNILAEKFSEFNNDYYSKYDSIADVADFDNLFEVLIKYKDRYGNHPVITANTIVANPDFKKIKLSNFEEYYYEPFNETILALRNGKLILEKWHIGMEKKIFHPQFHGREHLLVKPWLHELKNGNEMYLKAFEEGVYSVPSKASIYGKRNNLQAALDYVDSENLEKFQEVSISEGTQIFHKYFGYRSKSFIAPAYVWSRKLESVLFKNKIKFIQGTSIQMEPVMFKDKYKRILRYVGQTNRFKMTYLARNVFFEPSSNRDFDWFNDCLLRIEKSFKNRTPAIIGVHRVNFIGSLDPKNRELNLLLFDKLLNEIIKRWPEVEFMTSDELGDIIESSRK